jgi:hypothetical protein
MALPHENCAPGEVCCTSLYDVAHNILDIAFDAVVCCSVTDCNLPDITGYVSMGTRIEDPVADYLVVSLQSVYPSPQSADQAGNMQLPVYRANFQVKLLETGWPMPYGDDEEILVPDPELVNNVARHAYAHGEAMYRALANALARRTLNLGCRDCYQRIEPLVPVEPSGGTTGWMTNIVLGTNFGGG